MENKILYDQILSTLERVELFNDEKAMIVFSLILKPQQRDILNEIGIGRQNAVTCQDISNIVGVKSKNVSTQIAQIQKRFGRIKSMKVNNKTKYYIA